MKIVILKQRCITACSSPLKWQSIHGELHHEFSGQLQGVFSLEFVPNHFRSNFNSFFTEQDKMNRLKQTLHIYSKMQTRKLHLATKIYKKGFTFLNEPSN